MLLTRCNVRYAFEVIYECLGVKGGLWTRLRHYKASVSVTAAVHSCNASARVSLATLLYGTRAETRAIARSCSAHSVGLDDGELEGDLHQKDWPSVSIRTGLYIRTAALTGGIALQFQ